MMDRIALVSGLSSYQTPYSEEQKFINQFLDLLKAQNCFERTHLPGHITGSAWIVNTAKTKVLLVHHAKLNRWLQPGGHCDGDENVLRVALREAEEETGLTVFKKIDSTFFDLDIHPIPARKDFPEHFHFDVRFLMEADETQNITVSEESHDVKWVALDQLENFNPQQSLVRMKRKLLGSNQH